MRMGMYASNGLDHDLNGDVCRREDRRREKSAHS